MWVHGGSFCCGDKTSPEIVDEANTFARKGYFNVSINYRLEPGGCTAGASTPTCVMAIQEALRGRADCRPVPPYERGDLRHRRDSHRDRRLVRRRDHGAERRVQLQRRPDGCGGRRGVALRRAPPQSARSIPATHRACCSTARPTRRPVPVGREHVERGERASASTPSSRRGPAPGHVPYVQHRTEILDQTTNFLYWELDLANAAQ